MIINYAAISDNYYRWAEALFNRGDINNAEEKIQKSEQAIKEVLNINKNDEKANLAFRKILYLYGRIYERMNELSKAEEKYLLLKNLDYTKFKEMEFNALAILHLVDMSIKKQDYDRAKDYFTKELERIISNLHRDYIKNRYETLKDKLSSGSCKKRGYIQSVNIEKRFIIIECINDPKLTFISFLCDYKDRIDLNEDLIGISVTFQEDHDGRSLRAKNVILQNSEGQ